MAAASTSSRAGSRDGQQKVSLDAHRQQLQREIDRIAGLLNTREAHAGSIYPSAFNNNSGAPSNTPTHSPRALTGYSDSNYVTTPGTAANKNKNKTVKPLKTQLMELRPNDCQKSSYQEPYKNFLSVNDLLTSDHDSTFPGSSPLGDKTLEFINQTTMTGNHTVFLNTAQSNQSIFEPSKKMSPSGSAANNGETSNFLPMSVLDANKPVSLQSSPNRNHSVDLPYDIKARKSDILNCVHGQVPSSNDDKPTWGNPFGLPDPKHELALSSSPITTFETKFPDPKPIHELFDAVPVDLHLREDDYNEEDDETVSDNSLEEDDEPKHQAQNVLESATVTATTKAKAHQVKRTKTRPKTITKPKLQQNETLTKADLENDSIDIQLKLQDQLQRMSNSTQEDSEDLPKFEISSNNIKHALRKRKKISYNLEQITESNELIEDSPKTSRLKRRAKRHNLQPTTSHLGSSSPRKYKRASSSGSNRSYRRKKTVQPRSKSGCWTCRIRKKKCTEERPSCEQCIKLGLTCDGYSEERPHFMMNQQSQRQRLDQIKHHTTQRKKIGVRKIRVDE